MKTVVLITTGQPSVNPRIVKEADALQAAGYAVTVLYCYWIKWADAADDKLLKNVHWNYKLVGGNPSKNKLLYFFTKARFKLNIALNHKFGNKFLFAERSQARCFDELLAAAKSIKADWYIGHNLGALPIVVKAAAYHHAFTGFDFEDYHREENNNEPVFTKKRVVFLEEKYISHLSYISASSPHITARVHANFPSFSKPVITILNCFPVTQRPKKINVFAKSLQLFWFSQTVGKNRGLEAVISALKQLNNSSIHITLAGRCDREMTTYLKKNAGEIKDCIHLAGIIDPGQLPAFAAGFDVGLATEMVTPLNRNICLTNKIFTYLVAGNCILASDTEAQTDFINSYNGIGMLYRNNDVRDLAEKIRTLCNDSNILNQCKEKAFTLASATLNWENESKKLLQTISSITFK